MSFYLCPPSGSTNFNNLEKHAVTRLDFLLRLAVTNGDQAKVHELLTDISLVENSDCLIEGTRKDRISHFVLRLACVGCRAMEDFIRKAECELFEIRFHNMAEKSLSKLLHSLDPFLSDYEICIRQATSDLRNSDSVKVLQTFQTMLKQFESWENLIELYLSGSSRIISNIPFTFVLHLVRSRCVTLRDGHAFVPVSKLRLIIVTLFEQLLRVGLEKAKERYRDVIEDRRMKVLFIKLRHIFNSKYPSFRSPRGPQNVLLHNDVDTESQLFPPCMSHLHRKLRDKHRLRHHSRIQYTLFLKEVGLPVHEALMFWKLEYSLMTGDKKSCSHDWGHDGKRYTYNIRHLYGLEGSGVNYRGHCCQSLQRQFGHSEEGGCPFAQFDQDHLMDLHLTENINNNYWKEILESSAKGDYQGACLKFLQYKAQKFKDDKEQLSTGIETCGKLSQERDCSEEGFIKGLKSNRFTRDSTSGFNVILKESVTVTKSMDTHHRPESESNTCVSEIWDVRTEQRHSSHSSDKGADVWYPDTGEKFTNTDMDKFRKTSAGLIKPLDFYLMLKQNVDERV